MNTGDLLFEKNGDVGVMTLNRPARLNALSNDMMMEALDIINTASTEHSIRAMVITGAGRGFCTGADLAGGSGDSKLEDSAGSLGKDMKKSLNPLILAIVQAPFPVIAAVNGAAAGAGVGIALAADFMLAASSMKLHLTFSKIGMGLDAGTSWFLARQLGQRRAAAVSMLDEPITAGNAQDWGLAWSVTKDDEVMTEAMALATRLAAGPTLAFAAHKMQLRQALEVPLAEALEREADIQDELVKSADLKEGIAAFRDRRQANYVGK